MQAANKIQNSNRKAAQLFTIFILVLAATRRADAQNPEPNSVTPATIQHQRKVVVSLPHRKLALIEDGVVKKVYPVAVGADGTPSPTGTFQIKNRLERPTYFHPGKVIPAGPDNPLGTRWIGLTAKGYGIHGTNEERSVGKAASHGCIRMHRRDLEQLFAMVHSGDEVEILGEDDAIEISQIFGALPVPDNAAPSESAVAVVAGQ